MKANNHALNNKNNNLNKDKNKTESNGASTKTIANNNFSSLNYNSSINSINNSSKHYRINNRINNYEDRAIRSSGRYNLNFIDWNNEWERVNEVIFKLENGEQIEDKEEQQRIQNCLNKEKEKFGVAVNAFEIIAKPDTEKECYICLKNFSAKKKVRRLLCMHMFCEECISPWIKYNSKCPVCKFDFKQNDQNEQDDNFDYEIHAADI